ncbi:MAG: 4-hydroxy-tetrahydrodipicolinate synthase [Verrucomicrobiota bacterium]
MFEGTFTALVTPFQNDQLDESAFERLIEGQIRAGITGIVPVGTTGESPTLDYKEHSRVIELAVKFANKRCIVMAGTGSNSTSEAVALTVEAEHLGADAALLVAPYYNKPTQEGLFLHFAKIAEATKLPLMLYSIPGRCGIEIGVETVVRLVERFPNIVAIKEAGGSVERVSQLRSTLPASFQILSGDDSLTVPFISVGAVGVVSVASNVMPAQVGNLVKAALAGDFKTAREIHFQLYPLFKDLFIESNPVPAKAALARLGQMQPDVRLPLAPISAPNQAKLEATLRTVGLI